MTAPTSAAARDWEKLHQTGYSGILNRLTPWAWIQYSYDHTNGRRKKIIESRTRMISDPRIISVGAGEGGLLKYLWNEPGTVKVGVDVNFELAVLGDKSFLPVQGDAFRLPLKDASFDIAYYDLVLHHLVGQRSLEPAIAEAARVLKAGGMFIAFEPSSYFPSGVALNLANRLRLMNWLAGASNYEFAISPVAMECLLRRHFERVDLEGITYCWRRFPIPLQTFLRRFEHYTLRRRFAGRFAWTILYVAEKPSRPPETHAGGSA